MADDFAQAIRGLLKDADTISAEDYAIPMLVKKGTAYALPEIDATSGGLKVDLVDASGITVDVNLDYTDDEVTVYGSSDGGTTRYVLAVDSNGQLELAHDVNTNPVFAKVTDGTDELQIATDGAVAKTKGIQVLGSDGTNAQILSTDSSGQMQLAHDVNTNPVFAKVTDGTNEVEVAVAGSAHKSNGIQLMGSDGTNATRLKTTSDGEMIVNVGAADSIYVAGNANLVKDTATSVVSESPVSTTRYHGVILSGFGLCQWDIQFGTTSSESTQFVVQTTPSNPNAYFAFPAPLEVVSGETIKVVATNKENASSPASDFTGYATLIKEA